MSDLARFLEHAPSETRPLVERLARIVSESAPALQMVVDAAKISFHDRGEMVFGVFSLRSHVTLGIFSADGLPDPSGILAGAGRARHIRFNARSALDEMEIRALTMAAARLAASNRGP